MIKKFLIIKVLITSSVILGFLKPQLTLRASSEETGPPTPSQFYQQPHPLPEPLNTSQLQSLIVKANEGDIDAQGQLIDRNYWGLLDRRYQNSLWGVADRSAPRFNLSKWQNVEQRAIGDERYAYALIDYHAFTERWNQSTPLFSEQYPDLWKTITEKAQAGDPSAQFNYGIILKICRLPHSLASEKSMILDWVVKAATQNHPLAKTALGLIMPAYMKNSIGRNDIEASRWYLTTKEHQLSQKALKDLLVCKRQEPLQEGEFYTYIESVKYKAELFFREHSMRVGLHKPEGYFAENQFALPGYETMYQTLTTIEQEAVAALEALQKASDGFMITYVTFKERRDRERMISLQTQPPYVFFYTFNEKEYLTLGEENVVLASQFLTYLESIEEKFATADKILEDDCGTYQTGLNTRLAVLKELRLLGLHYQKQCQEEKGQETRSKLDKTKKEFDALTKEYLEVAPILTKAIQDIEEERTTLTQIKESIQNIVSESLGIRNYQFSQNHIFLE